MYQAEAYAGAVASEESCQASRVCPVLLELVVIAVSAGVAGPFVESFGPVFAVRAGRPY